MKEEYIVYYGLGNICYYTGVYANIRRRSKGNN